MTASAGKKGRVRNGDVHLEMPSQMDLFLGDLMAPATKNDRASMEHPFLAVVAKCSRPIWAMAFKVRCTRSSGHGAGVPGFVGQSRA